MESTAASTPSLKKLKREAAQRRKSQARSLKLRADEQERLQRLEIDALVEQERLQRLERQRRKEDAEKLAQEASSLNLSHQQKSTNEDSKCTTKVKQNHSQQQQQAQSQCTQQQQNKKQQQQQTGLERLDDNKKPSTGRDSPPAWPSKKEQTVLKGPKQVNNQQNQLQQQQQQEKQQHQQQQQQQQQMRAVVESRRRLARGPRSGNLVVTVSESHSVNSHGSVLPLEDHRVVSTEYQAAGTQALMRVTLLAAGFVIGARGISARLIGQITGAIIQSWTESSTNNGVPIRLFRIQGKKAVVQAAVALVEQAVAKYKELCECKRRGEFVQREHVINGVEFYYQPPPRKAFAPSVPDHLKIPPVPTTSTSSATATANVAPNSNVVSEVPLTTSLAFPPHHVWLHHLQQAQQAQLQKQALQQQQNEQQSKQEDDKTSPATPSSPAASEVVQSVTCLEQAVLQQQQQASTLDQCLVDANANLVDHSAAAGSTWVPNANADRGFQMGSSLFSIFGNGGLPLPIAQDCRPPNAPVLKSSVSTTPFDFPKYDFFREILPAFPIVPPPLQQQQQQQRDEYNPYAHHHHLQHLRHPSHQQQQAVQAEELCVVCVERPLDARLMSCGHASFCLSCVQGLGNCPVCREKVVGWQPLRGSGNDMNGGNYDLWGSARTSL